MGGGGFLKSMVDSIRSNRDLVHKRQSLKDIYRQSEAKNAGTPDPKDVTELLKIHRNRLQKDNQRSRLRSRIFILATLIILVFVTILLTSAPGPVEHMRYEPKKIEPLHEHFITYYHTLSASEKMREDFFNSGSIAAETLYKNEKKHQNSVSYYETGEQFRSALYFYDTLVIDLYLYKDGDTIKDMPEIDFNTISHVKLTHDTLNISFDMLEGKILPGSYTESKLIEQ